MRGFGYNVYWIIYIIYSCFVCMFVLVTKMIIVFIL